MTGDTARDTVPNDELGHANYQASEHGTASELRDQIAEARRLAADTTDRVLADRVPKLIAAYERAVARAEAKVAEYENAITWDTSCLSCAAVLDSSIKETERAETAERRRDQAENRAALYREQVRSEHDRAEKA